MFLTSHSPVRTTSTRATAFRSVHSGRRASTHSKMPGDASTTPRSPYSRSSSMPTRALNRPFDSAASPRTPLGARTPRDSPRSGAATPNARDLPSTATVDLSEDEVDVLRTMYEDVAIASRFRTKPSAVELMAHALPGRNTYGDKIEWGKDTKLRNQVQLSTYPDCIGGNLSNLRSFTDRYLQGVVGGVHVLPFYPSSADRGFAPLTYKEVSPQFGNWDDIESIGDGLDLCMDFMVNHISAQSEQFKDFQEKGDASEWAELFIRYNKFWGGEPTAEDLGLIYTRKPRPPFLEVKHADGTSQKVWCTFDYEQVDIDAFSALGSRFIEDQLAALCEHGCSLIRLDAFGYTTKRKGTNCFFVEPEVWELLDRCNAMLKKRGTELLCEVHEHFSMQKRLAEKGFWVYDFALPMLTLQALYDGDANNIKAWWLKCPRNQITTLDTHDGLGVVDVADLMSQEQIDRTKANIFDRGANANMRFNTKEYGNLDIYQINCSYYSAVGDKDDWYVLARAIQFFTPGIPLVYYVGLLAGRNDIERVESTKVGRDINRHGYDLQEAISECDRPVVKVLFELCRFRNHHPAFNGEFELLDTIPDIKESTVLLPPTALSPGPNSPIPTAVSPAASVENMTEGPPGVSGSFAAQTVSLQASLDDHNQDFLADVVLERASIDVLASVDPGDASSDPTTWEVDQIVAAGFSGAIDGRPATIPEDGPLADGPAKAPEPEVDEEPVATREDPSDKSMPATEAEVAERLSNLDMKKKVGKIPLVDSSTHLDVSKPGSLVLTDADLPFQPFSAALRNLKDKESLLSPAALASADPEMMTPLQQVRMVRMASRRDPEHDLPANVLCCKWTNGDNWAVMEANLDTKDLRILYVDPFDGRQKVWAVTRSLQVYKEQQAASCPPSSVAPKGTAADAA